MRFTTLHRNVAALGRYSGNVRNGVMRSISARGWRVPWRNAFVMLLLFLSQCVFGSMVSAAPPVLTDFTVSPSGLQVDTGVHPVDVSVQVSDPDGNLKSDTVKLVATFEDGTKEKLVLADTEDGRFAGQIAIDTRTMQEVQLKVKAKDRAGEKAARVTVVLPVSNADHFPMSLVAEEMDFTVGFGQIVSLSASVVNREDLEANVSNQPVTFTVESGDGIFVSESSNGPLGVSTVVSTNTDGTATIMFHAGRHGQHSVRAESVGLPTSLIYSVITVTPSRPKDVAVEADGSFVLFDSRVNGIIRINPATGERRVVSSANAGVGTGPSFMHVEHLAVGRDGSLFALDGGLEAVLRVNPVTGDRAILSGCSDEDCDAQIGVGPPLTSLQALAVDDGVLLLGNSSALLRVDTEMGDRSILSGCADPVCETVVIGSGPLPRGGPQAIVVENDGSLIFSDGPTVFRVNRVTGDRAVISGCDAFVEGSCVSEVGSGPFLFNVASMIIEANGSLVVMAQLRQPGLFRIDPVTGDRTILSGCRDPTEYLCGEAMGKGLPFQMPSGLALEPDGTVVVADEGFEHVVRVDPSTGDRTPVASSVGVGDGPGLLAPRALSIGLDGAPVVVDALLGLLRVDPVSGVRTVLSGCPEPIVSGQCDSPIGSGPLFEVRSIFRSPWAMAVEESGSVLIADTFSGEILRFDIETGDRTVLVGCSDPALPGECDNPIGDGPEIPSLRSIAVEADGDLVVVGQSGAVFRVNSATGDRTVLSNQAPLGILRAIAVEPDGTLVVGDGPRGLLRVNPETGDRTFLSGCPGEVSGTTPTSTRSCSAPFVGDGPAFGRIVGIAVADDGLLVVDSELYGVLKVDPETGDRTIISGCRERASRITCADTVGNGPELLFPSGLAIEPDGSILVLDEREIIRVDPVTGDRTVLSR